MMEDLDDVTQSSEKDSECHELPYLADKNVWVLIEQLRMECKDPSSLLKIQEVIHSYKSFIQLKNRHCKLLTEKFEKMENDISRLQQKLSETEHEKVKQHQELFNLRFALKQEEKKRKAVGWLSEKVKGELRKTEEYYNKEVETKQQLDFRVRALDMELKTIRNYLDQLPEAWDQHTKAVQCAEKTEDCTQKLELENSKLKVMVKKQTEEIECLKKNLLSANLNEDLTTKLETAFSEYLLLDKENQFLWQELSTMKLTQKKCEKLETRKRKLEQQIVTLKSHMEKNMLECGQAERYKWDIEEKTKQDFTDKMKQLSLVLQTQEAHQEQLEQLRNAQYTSMRSEMEVRIRDLESELSKMKNQADYNDIEAENYKQLYIEEVKIRNSLSNKLSKRAARLEETTLLLERQQTISSQESILKTSPVPGSDCIGNLRGKLLFMPSFSRENLMIPTSDLQPSFEVMQDQGVNSHHLHQKATMLPQTESTSLLFVPFPVLCLS